MTPEVCVDEQNAVYIRPGRPTAYVKPDKLREQVLLHHKSVEAWLELMMPEWRLLKHIQ